MQELESWEILQSDYVLDNKFWRIRCDQVRLPDGTIYDEYYVREHPGWVGIFCLTEDNKIVLIRQYKHGAGRVVIELPAGAIDPGEEPAKAAKRELEEETGYQAEDMEYVQTFASDPSNSNSQVRLYIARNARPTGKQQNTPSEIIEVLLASPQEVVTMIRKGEINSLGHVGTIYAALDKLDIKV